jgi:hypothetical protein
MKKDKPGYYMKDGDFVKRPDGSYIDVCDYKNCRQPVGRLDKMPEAYKYRLSGIREKTTNATTVKNIRNIK